jgi:hypothetical protein
MSTKILGLKNEGKKREAGENCRMSSVIKNDISG